MSRFRKIKKKKPSFKKRERIELALDLAFIEKVDFYQATRPGRKISIDQACEELEKAGLLPNDER